MSDMDKTIERVKLNCTLKLENYDNDELDSDASIAEVLAIISDRERLKAELEKEQYDHRVRRCAHKADNKTYKAELSKAQAKIKELIEIVGGSDINLIDKNKIRILGADQ